MLVGQIACRPRYEAIPIDFGDQGTELADVFGKILATGQFEHVAHRKPIGQRHYLTGYSVCKAPPRGAGARRGRGNLAHLTPQGLHAPLRAQPEQNAAALIRRAMQLVLIMQPCQMSPSSGWQSLRSAAGAAAADGIEPHLPTDLRSRPPRQRRWPQSHPDRDLQAVALNRYAALAELDRQSRPQWKTISGAGDDIEAFWLSPLWEDLHHPAASRDALDPRKVASEFGAIAGRS